MKIYLSRLFLGMTSYLLYWLVRAFNASYRYSYEGLEHRRAAEAHHAQTSFILAVWHENLFVSILSQIGYRFCPLASRSRDGDYVAFVLEHLGFEAIRGSSTRGGPEARTQILSRLAVGVNAAITVDGPKGPRREAKPGVVDIARKSGAAILPMAVVGNRAWTLRSWDRFRIPKPFSRIVVRYGQPIFVASDRVDAAFETHRKSLKRALDDLDELALKDVHRQQHAWRAQRSPSQ